jgi:hypothetical protein
VRDHGSLGAPHKAGNGGWPTIKYFNKETGPAGEYYSKKTQMPMCSELSEAKYMYGYVEEKAGVRLPRKSDKKKAEL